MTKYFLRLLLLFGSVIAFFALIGSLLPRNYDFSSEIEIAAPADEIFPEINQLSKWQTWSHWNPVDVPGLTVQYTGNETGEGSTQSWTEVRGEGKLWITKSVPPERVEYEMLFANFPKMSGSISLSESGESTMVRWSNRGRLPNGPFYGFFAPFFSTQMQAVYDQSLQRLEKKIKQGQRSQ